MSKSNTTSQRNLLKIQTKYGLSEDDVFIAILLSSGMPSGSVFRFAFKSNVSNPDMACKVYLDNHAKINDLVRDLKSISKENQKVTSSGFDLRDKQGMIDALQCEYEAAEDPKQRADILTRIADLQKMKQDEDKNKEQLVHFYLPLRCNVCPWKQAKAPEF